MPRPWLAVLLLLLAARPGLAQPEDEPPVRNRPARFNGAVGSFAIRMEADPAAVRADQSLTLTVRITAAGPVREPPGRPNLRALSDFTERFYVEGLPGPDDHPGERAGDTATKGPWVFRYRLRPRGAQVDAVPSLPFVFYRPARPGSLDRGSYQTAYAKRVPLTIRPASADLPPSEGTPAAPPPAPPGAYEIVEGPAVRRRGSPWPGAVPVVVVVLAGVPALGVGWYLLWRRRYPDAARLARQRRSRAARQALKALYGLRSEAGDEQARKAAAVLTAYLRERVDLPAVAPTAEEAAAHLQKVGISADAVGKVAQLFHAVDVARFAPQPPAGPGDWAGTAEALILTLEAEPCLSPAS